ncbi:MAG TPA: Asp-tRNA(Asn)/Glu-tRNA(Gln) amidotransferase subunit GatC [Thermoanaerobacterales bacterium]|nr:Asp-tRNA(Asn)/Glu-tRNA(Gln) amidotransferase subunit GatC [Thermoanaerobacterales bacterium]
MKITKADIEHISDMAMLNLSEGEKENFAEELNEVLKQVKRLEELDTKDVKPMVHLLPLKNIWREDKREPSLDSELIFKNTKNREEDFFKVPKIIED